MQKISHDAKRDVLSDIESVVAIITKTDNSLADYFKEQREMDLISASFEIQNSEIDLGFYCSKTGKPIGEVSLKLFSELINIHGEKRAKHILEVLKIGKIDPRWLYTDGQALTELVKNDPYGYFVYVCANLLIPIQDTIIRNQDFDPEKKHKFQLELLNERRQCWNNIQSVPLNEIFEANQVITKFLSIFRTHKVYSMISFIDETVSPSSINITKSIQELITGIRESISNILKEEISHGRLNRHLTVNDLANLKNRFKGYSNMRAMSGRTRISQSERILEMLDDFIPEETKKKYRGTDYVLNSNKLPISSKRSKKVINGTKAITLKVPKTGFVLNWSGKDA